MSARRLVAFALASTLVVAGCSSGSSDEAKTTAGGGDVRLTDLTDVEQLRTRFNEDRGTPRLILLLAPT